jgi:hypothetical protein
MNTKKLRRAAKRASQPGPWRSVKNDDGRYVVLDDHGCWVADIGADPLQSAFIAAADPQTIIALLDELDDALRRLSVETSRPPPDVSPAGDGDA